MRSQPNQAGSEGPLRDPREVHVRGTLLLLGCVATTGAASAAALHALEPAGLWLTACCRR